MEQKPIGALTPFRHRIFQMMWTAMLSVNIAACMQEVGAGWLMATLKPSPLMVSLVQAAVSLPVFLLAIPAGALADIVDRRRYLIVLQIWLSLCAGTLGVLTLLNITHEYILLAATCGIGFGIAMMMPAWGAVIPELVPREELPQAVVLNSLGVNIARSLGPAIAGVMIACAGSGAVFVANACFYIFILSILVIWRRNVKMSTLPKETLFHAIKTGLHYAQHSDGLRAVVVRGICFFIFASSSWALLPLIVKHQLQKGPSTYGLMYSCIGMGAICGAVMMSRVVQYITRDTLIRCASVVYGICLLALSQCTSVYVASVVMFFIGLAWIQSASALMSASQIILPSWVRARGLAFFWIVLTGGLAGGSVIWGNIAEFYGISISLIVSAIGLFVGIGISWRFYVSRHDHENLTLVPSDWTIPLPEHIPTLAGPVRIRITYTIDPKNKEKFLNLMQQLKAIRLKNGSDHWQLLTDTYNENCYVETYIIESVLEWLRQRERLTVTDFEIRKQVRELHIGPTPPKVVHMIETLNQSF